MLVSPKVAYLVVLTTALLPGVVSWFLGHRLIRRLADPTLPELLAGHRRRIGVVFSVAMAVLSCAAVLSHGNVAVQIIAGFVIAYSGLVAAAYPLRRALYNETWSFASYCLFYPRGVVGVFGFWLTLAALPEVLALAGEDDWLYGLPLGLGLAIWNARYADVLRWSLRSQLLPEGDVLSDCRTLAQKCELPDVRFECIPLGGGVIANALALPSLRGSSVLFTETLLERFDREEIRAVAAHELAHFDHYTPAHLRRLGTINSLLIAAAIAAGPVARILGSGWGLVATLVWLFLVIVALALRARGKQRQETMCDAKAVKLTGNPEALISGLTKLYTIARLPRRLDNRSEQAATHPSLARRIRDIRKATGSQPETLAATHTFSSADGRSSATFDAAGLKWVDQDGITYTLSYSHLTELRVDVASGRSTQLVAVGPSARRWELALQDGDVAKVQGVLDSIDGKLADPPPPRLGLTFSPDIRRIVLLATFTIVLSFSQLGMALVALLTWAKPTMPMFVGAGLATLTTAAFTLRDVSDHILAELWIPLAVLGLFFFGLAWSARDQPRDGTRKYTIVLAVAAALLIAATLSQGLNIVDLHRSARSLPSATVLLVALAGVLVCSTDRRERIAALVAVLSAAVITSIASTPFLDRFGTDPFLVHSRPLQWVTLDAAPIVAIDVPSNTSRITLSPSGRYVAVYSTDGDPDVTGEIQLGPVGETLTVRKADDVAFVSDDELLTITSRADSTVVQGEKVAASADVMWRREFDDVSEPTLSFNRATNRWSLIGWDGEDTIVRIDGAVDGSGLEEKRWPVGHDRGYIAAMTSSGSAALIHEHRYDPGPLSQTLPSRWTSAQAMLYLSARSVSHFSSIDEHGNRSSYDSKLEVACLADALPTGSLACTAYDGSRTHIVTIEAGTGRVAGVGFLDGQFMSDHSSVEGWLTGWNAGRPVAIHLPTAAVFHAPPAMRTLRFIPVAADRLAALTFAVQQVKAAVYAPVADGASAREAVAHNRTRAVRP